MSASLIAAADATLVVGVSMNESDRECERYSHSQLGGRVAL